MTIEISPDGERYLALARGEAQPMPYHFRWLLPKLLGEDLERWRNVQYGSAVALAIEAWAYTGTPAAMLVPFGLAGVTKINFKYPVLVDLPAMAAALASACFLLRLPKPIGIPAAVACAAVAGGCKETAPLFAAMWSGSPWPLLGLAVPAARLAERPGPHEDHEGLTKPWRYAWKHRREQRDPALYLLPWGVLLLGFIPNKRVALTLAAAYAQLLLGSDRDRLYQWAWPVLADAMFKTAPRKWRIPLGIGALVNPFQGSGV